MLFPFALALFNLYDQKMDMYVRIHLSIRSVCCACACASCTRYNMYSIHMIHIKFNSFGNLFLGILFGFLWLSNHLTTNWMKKWEWVRERKNVAAEKQQRLKYSFIRHLPHIALITFSWQPEQSKRNFNSRIFFLPAFYQNIHPKKQ